MGIIRLLSKSKKTVIHYAIPTCILLYLLVLHPQEKIINDFKNNHLGFLLNFGLL